ncbi:MAG TPA: DUF5134 domain-containing protein [Yinghuangia sp.]|uniref:DUF5134 domain-containing protein n=1 Tax=Yinghuangia sp. YIM S10712 TaxID=3436930 RepID=UPI002B5C8C91|nr:DUF5134 domain-containing protein [Yinghuangia sp.]
MDAQLLAAELGIAAGLVGAYAHRRGGRGAWLPHLIMGGAMGAMALPQHDPLGPGGWMLVLGGAAAWAWGRPTGNRKRGGGRAGVAMDLYVMGVLTLLMPAVHGGGHGSGASHETGGDAASDWWSGPYAALLVVWALARVVVAAAEYRRCAGREPGFDARGEMDSGAGVWLGAAKSSVSSACSVAMIGAMTVMAFGP